MTDSLFDWHSIERSVDDSISDFGGERSRGCGCGCDGKGKRRHHSKDRKHHRSRKWGCKCEHKERRWGCSHHYHDWSDDEDTEHSDYSDDDGCWSDRSDHSDSDRESGDDDDDECHCHKKHHHHEKKKKKCCFDVVIINQNGVVPPVVKPGSPCACGCSKLIKVLSCLLSNPNPTAKEIDYALLRSEKYVRCRTTYAMGGLDVIALQQWIAFQVSLPPGVISDHSRMLLGSAITQIRLACESSAQ